MELTLHSNGIVGGTFEIFFLLLVTDSSLENIETVKGFMILPHIIVQMYLV